MLIKYSRLSPRQALIKFFEILNAANPDSSKILSEKEILLLVEFLLLDNKKFYYQRFSSVAKNIVIENLAKIHDWELSKINLNNKLYSLIKKGALRRDTDNVIYIQDYIYKGAQSILSAIENRKSSKIVFDFDYT